MTIHTHTPTPWTYIASNCSNFVHIETDTDHSTIATLAKGTKSQKEANAAFIVRACNAHELLVEALKLHLAFLDSLPEGWLGKTTGDVGLLNDAYIASSKALKLARGE